MPTHIYKNARGVRVPSVTTVIKRFQESGGLIRWAYDCGVNGIDIDKARDSAAGSGTLAHEMIDRFFAGQDPYAIRCDDEVMFEAARQGFASFAEWIDQTKIKIVERETPLVSEALQVGGTPDAIGVVNGQRFLLDWKTSNSVYVDHLVQVAAYGCLWEENHPGDRIDGGFHLCRFSKEHADFAHRFYRELDAALKAFRLYREAYDLDKGLKKRVG